MATDAPVASVERVEKVMKPRVDFEDIVKTILYISRGVELNQPRLTQRGLRQNASVRKLVTTSQLSQLVKKYVPVNWPTMEVMGQLIEKIAGVPAAIEDDKEAPTSQGDEEAKSAMSVEEPTFTPVTSLLPEVEIYLLTLLVTTLLRYKLDQEAAYASTFLIERLRTFNRRSLDPLASKAFFYFSLSYERIGRLEQIRPTLLQLYRTSCVRHDVIGQAVLLNLLLSNYLDYNLYDQAHTLSLRASFPENASNNQFCRYLHSMGRILATQLEYSEAYQRLMMAYRKAPQGYALGFSRTVTKLIVIVQLLMGEIPERSIFNQTETHVVLAPYLALTQAVRNGDLVQFNHVVEQHKKTFTEDKNFTLVQRLGHNVLKTGLRKISLSYSRISLADVALKLHLPSGGGGAAAEYICARAICDGVIEAKIDSGCLCTKSMLDIYSSDEPQKAFHRRIAFCLDVHNEAVKSMRYPSAEEEAKDDPSKDKGKADEKTIEELIREMEEDIDE